MTVIPSAAEPPGGPWSVNDMNAPVKTNAPRKWKRPALMPIGTASKIRPSEYVDVVDTVLDMAEGKKTVVKQAPGQPPTSCLGKLGASVYNKLDYAGSQIANILGISEGRYEEYYEDCESYEHDMARVSIGAQERIATGELREALRKPENAIFCMASESQPKSMDARIPKRNSMGSLEERMKELLVPFREPQIPTVPNNPGLAKMFLETFSGSTPGYGKGHEHTKGHQPRPGVLSTAEAYEIVRSELEEVSEFSALGMVQKARAIQSGRHISLVFSRGYFYMR
ncbi:hypothetical protein HDU79_002278 [Rhizoclosmatium sp. JEL0117]|nr:hypothetical protein HDU79_002278 [Rhizoclosmatium sp. JEL0117]